MTRIRIGVTGSGFMGRTHVDAAHRLETTEIVAVAGGQRAMKLAEDYQITREPDTAALIRRDDLDAIVIATPHHCHVDEGLLAAETGKHALIEKPLATSVEDCDRLIQAFDKHGLTLSVGYHQRFRDSNLRTRELIRSGAIGPVRCIQMSSLFDAEAMRADSGFGGDWGWWRDPRSVAHLLNSAPHNVDLCRWWMGTELVNAVGHSATVREENPNENTTMALMSFANGAMATFWSSSVLPAPGFVGEDFRFRIMGDDGLIDLNPFDELRLARGGEWETVHKQPPVEFDNANAAFEMGRMQAYCGQMEAFVQSIQGVDSGVGTALDGRAGVAAVVAMLKPAVDAVV